MVIRWDTLSWIAGLQLSFWTLHGQGNKQHRSDNTWGSDKSKLRWSKQDSPSSDKAAWCWVTGGWRERIEKRQKIKPGHEVREHWKGVWTLLQEEASWGSWESGRMGSFLDLHKQQFFSPIQQVLAQPDIMVTSVSFFSSSLWLDRVSLSLCGPGLPGTYCTDQAGLALPLDCWDWEYAFPHLAII